MTTRIYALVCVVAMAVMCGGCYPYHFTDKPGAKGRVVDARTRRPVAGTKVVMSNSVASLPSWRDGSAVASADGTFLIAPRQSWGLWYLLPMDPMRWHVRVSFSAAGYGFVTREFNASTFGPAVTDLGTVGIAPKRERDAHPPP